MDWTSCVICHKNIAESLCCPSNRPGLDTIRVYEDFLANVEEFRQLDALPVNVEFGCDGTAEKFLVHGASWHRSCHQKFNNSKLLREKNRKRKQEEEQNASDVRRSKRKPLPNIKECCLFCETSTPGKLHEFSTFGADQSIRHMAKEMQDEKISTKIDGVDLIALEGKYHLACLIQYRNSYRSHLRQSSTPTNSDRDMAKARAFAELVSYVENSLGEGIPVFKVSDFRQSYENRLAEFGQELTVNKPRFKAKLLQHFSDMGIQEQSDGMNTILVFPEGMQQMINDAFLVHNYESEALLFSKVAKICREELFQEDNAQFCGSFPPKCQESILPSLRLLTSMILYGPNLDGDVLDSQACLSISQMMLMNER